MTASVTADRALRYAGGSARGLLHHVLGHCHSGVMDAQTPEVLTLNPDYLLIKGGLARFVYRLARKAAGDGQADYGFDLVRARSGSLRRAPAFDADLRALIAANDLPDYALTEVRGASGSVLRMRRRT